MNGEVPKHRRVYAALRHDILIGKYDADELDEDIEAVRSAVEAWRKARKAKSRA